MTEEKKQISGLTWIGIIIIGIFLGWIAVGYFNQSSNNVSLESQCQTKTKDVYDSVVKEFTAKHEATYGVGSKDTYDYSYHYSKSKGACILSLHDSLYVPAKGVQFDLYFLIDLTKDRKDLATLYYFTTPSNNAQTIAQCEVNSLPCTSISEYRTLTEPYLNN